MEVKYFVKLLDPTSVIRTKNRVNKLTENAELSIMYAKPNFAYSELDVRLLFNSSVWYFKKILKWLNKKTSLVFSLKFSMQ